MPQKPSADEFDSVQYWTDRHNEFGADPRGVGNATLDSEENQQIYEANIRAYSAIVAALDLPKGARVLDLGCGIGMMAPAFLANGCSYTGVDVSETAIGIARKAHPDGIFKVGNIADLPADGPFDLILERTVFIHLIEDAYWESVLAEVARVLAKDGLFLLQDNIPAKADPQAQAVSHVKFRLQSDYKKALKPLGLAFESKTRRKLTKTIPNLSPNLHFVRRS